MRGKCDTVVAHFLVDHLRTNIKARRRTSPPLSLPPMASKYLPCSLETRAPDQITPTPNPNSSGSRSFFCQPIPGATRGDKGASPASKHAMRDKGGQGETKQSERSPAKSSQPSIQTCHWRQRGKGEITRDKAKSSQPSIQTRHGNTPWETRRKKGTQRETKEHKAKHKTKSSQPSIQTRHGNMPWETRKDKGKQRQTKEHKAKSSQPSIQTRYGRQGGQGETKGGESSWPSIVSIQESGTPHSKTSTGKK